MYVKTEIDINDLDRLLWSGAADRWENATDEQRERVWEAIVDIFCDNADEYPDMTTINDFVWFECDDIFNDDEEEDDEDKD
jgi:hypothetical protein